MINVSFRGFWRAVNAIGCVYADIDHDYYNDSAEYTFIDIDAGYQRLCARKALQYVRFRHTDTDLVRSARQQDFLRQAKQQITTSQLFEQRVRLLRIFGRNTSTDTALRSSAEVLRLLKLAVGSAGLPVQEIHFEGQIGPSYVEATNEQVKKLVQQFLNVEDTPGPRGERGGEAGAAQAPQAAPPARRRPRSASTTPAVSARTRASRRSRPGAGGSLPVLLPDAPAQLVRVRGRSPRLQGEGPGRQALRRLPDGDAAARTRTASTTAFRAPTWQDPPILGGPTETRKLRGQEYELHYAGDRLRLVAWHTPEGGLLDLEHAAPDAQREADARDRPLRPALLLS